MERANPIARTHPSSRDRFQSFPPCVVRQTLRFRYSDCISATRWEPKLAVYPGVQGHLMLCPSLTLAFHRLLSCPHQILFVGVGYEPGSNDGAIREP